MWVSYHQYLRLVGWNLADLGSCLCYFSLVFSTLPARDKDGGCRRWLWFSLLLSCFIMCWCFKSRAFGFKCAKSVVG